MPSTSSIRTSIESALRSIRSRRPAWLFVVNLRILLGFALLPAGLKKVLGEPFTDPANTGPFHDFLDAFLATGAFYHLTGVVQVIVAVLLMTQRFAAVGALVFAPIITIITVFCWSTAVYPTASVATLMWLGGAGLVFFDAPTVFVALAKGKPDSPPPIDLRLWGRAGLAIAVFYIATVAINGGVYRPRGFEPDNPAFWTLPALVLFPVVAALLEKRARRRRVRT